MPSKLGQNFLKNKEIVNRIIESANLKTDDVVLEIGPGKGALTEELLKKAGKVIAVELDKTLVEYLQNKFKESSNIEIINEDILKLKLEGIINTKYKVIANIPYYITSPIIRYFLENELPPKEMILMVQKEVAERIVAMPGNHSILSLSVQYYAKPELLFYVDKTNFDPVPEVDSAVIRIVTSDEQQETKEKSDNFFRVVRAGFCAKRKTLANNLANSFHLNKREVEEKLKTVPLNGTVRAQELSIDEWKNISKIFS